MSTAAGKTKPNPLSLEDTLRDLAILRASDVDLSAILASTAPGSVPTSAPSTDTPTKVDESVARSYEFVREARAAIKIKNRGDAEAQGERVDDVRNKLEDVVAGLQGS